MESQGLKRLTTMMPITIYRKGTASEQGTHSNIDDECKNHIANFGFNSRQTCGDWEKY